MSSAPSAEYIGTDNLEIMALAQNYNRHIQRRLRRAVGNAEVLDFGAGTGEMAAELQAQGLRVTCLEPDAHHRQLLQKKNLRHIGDPAEVGSHRFRGVYSLNVLEHIENDQKALDQIYSLMQPGGRFYLYVPAFPLLFTSMDEKVGHFRRYKKKSLCQKLQKSGFRIHSARYVDVMGFAVTLAYRLLGSRQGDLNRWSVLFFDRVLFPINSLLDPLLGSWIGKNLEIVCEK